MVVTQLSSPGKGPGLVGIVIHVRTLGRAPRQHPLPPAVRRVPDTVDPRIADGAELLPAADLAQIGPAELGGREGRHAGPRR